MPLEDQKLECKMRHKNVALIAVNYQEVAVMSRVAMEYRHVIRPS